MRCSDWLASLKLLTLLWLCEDPVQCILSILMQVSSTSSYAKHAEQAAGFYHKLRSETFICRLIHFAEIIVRVKLDSFKRSLSRVWAFLMIEPWIYSETWNSLIWCQSLCYWTKYCFKTFKRAWTFMGRSDHCIRCVEIIHPVTFVRRKITYIFIISILCQNCVFIRLTSEVKRLFWSRPLMNN